MICITGAGGTLGCEIIRQLILEKTPFRGAFFSEDKANAARRKGIEAVTIDYNRPETLQDGFKDCEKLFLLGPNVPNQTALEMTAVEAAKAAKISCIVKQSVMGSADKSFSLAKVHRPVEEAIESSGIAWTFLRPNSFMQNIVTFMRKTIIAESTFYSSSEMAKISHVDVRDIAAVAVRALLESHHVGKAYTLTGPEALTYDAIAGELSMAFGRKIQHISLSPSDLRKGMIADGMPDVIADRMLDLERYFREGHASQVTSDIMQVTGRKPMSYLDYIRETVDSFV